MNTVLHSIITYSLSDLVKKGLEPIDAPGGM